MESDFGSGVAIVTRWSAVLISVVCWYAMSCVLPVSDFIFALLR